VQQSCPDRAAKGARAISEQHKRRSGGQREARPRGERTEVARAHQADREPDLATGRAGEKLAQPDKIGIGVFVDPFSPDHELVAEVADMRDRAAEAGQPELEEDAEHFQRAGTGAVNGRVSR
jgi:hypothetical protein